MTAVFDQLASEYDRIWTRSAVGIYSAKLSGGTSGIYLGTVNRRSIWVAAQVRMRFV